MACRDLGKAAAAIEESDVLKSNKAYLQVMKLDLADLRSVKQFAVDLGSDMPIDCLVCNAGTLTS
jgi:NAD(P)-dependent dehydrogenase (short-subunit alcohol dehydrogenase family)